MTDLAARLRDVLSDEMLIDLLLGAQDYEAERNGTPRRSREYCLPEFRDCVVKAFLPFLSSLLEEREREIREALMPKCATCKYLEQHMGTRCQLHVSPPPNTFVLYPWPEHFGCALHEPRLTII